MSEPDYGIKEDEVDLGPLPDPDVPLVPSKADELEPEDLHSSEDEDHDDNEDPVEGEEADLGGDPIPDDDGDES